VLRQRSSGPAHAERFERVAEKQLWQPETHRASREAKRAADRLRDEIGPHGRMLEAAGSRPDMAGNGAEAVTMHRMMHYDAILMDCQMPEMNGFEATAEIRRLDGNSGRTAIIAMTAETTAGSRERCLAKPIKTAELVDALRKWA
jgi:CheY-like chemotaxis protein